MAWRSAFSMNDVPWSKEDFSGRLREIGTSSYHHNHPFHLRMNEGRLGQEEIRGWVANRFYYQRNIPIKDAAILANCPVREVRRAWIHRILDHDGLATRRGGLQSAQLGQTPAAGTPPLSEEGGTEAGLRLAEACGIARDELFHNRH